MPEPVFRGDDEIREFLGPRPSSMPNEKLRETVLMQTTRALRRRRRVKRLGMTAALALCYAAGVLTTQLWRSSESLPGTGSELANAESSDLKNPATPAEPTAKEFEEGWIDMNAVAPAIVLERMGASLEGEKRVSFYRLAGDRYLESEGDVSAAVRCYGRSLEAASDKELVISTDDNWLFMAMKKARQGERANAKSDS